MCIAVGPISPIVGQNISFEQEAESDSMAVFGTRDNSSGSF